MVASGGNLAALAATGMTSAASSVHVANFDCIAISPYPDLARKNARPLRPRHGTSGRASGVEFTRRRTLFRRAWPSERPEHAIQRRIADAEPVLLADEVVPQVILLDPASKACARLVGNMGDI